jgi:hypothetical protein
MLDVKNVLEREKEEMRIIDHKFEEKTQNLAHVINFQQEAKAGGASRLEREMNAAGAKNAVQE